MAAVPMRVVVARVEMVIVDMVGGDHIDRCSRASVSPPRLFGRKSPVASARGPDQVSRAAFAVAAQVEFCTSRGSFERGRRSLVARWQEEAQLAVFMTFTDEETRTRLRMRRGGWLATPSMDTHWPTETRMQQWTLALQRGDPISCCRWFLWPAPEGWASLSHPFFYPR